MATAEEQRTEIEVHNPATGELIRSVHATSIDELRAMAERGRAAQPAWEALGFDGRAKVLRRAQKWTTDNAERIAKTIVAESGKAYEDALLAEVSSGMDVVDAVEGLPTDARDRPREEAKIEKLETT